MKLMYLIGEVSGTYGDKSLCWSKIRMIRGSQDLVGRLPSSNASDPAKSY